MLARNPAAVELPATFCSLRWRYLQCDLAHGQVKACCKTPFVEVGAADVAALGERAIFNNPYFVERRREMLAGISHADCAACYDHEAAGIVSYRQSEGGKAIFSTPNCRTTAADELADAWPTHVELMLSTTCDLRCAYCDPHFSSAWAAEQRSGPRDESLSDIVEPPKRGPQFAAAFESWLRAALPRLQYLQFNGGEPLLQKEFYAYLDLVESQRGRLQVGLISNLNTPERAFRRFLSRLPDLIDGFDLRIAVSQEAVGARAEYIRYGVVWTRFESNLRRLLAAVQGRPLHLAPTMSALNVTSFGDYVTFIETLAQQHDCDFVWRPSLVHEPAHLSPLVAGPSAVRRLADLAERLGRSGRWPDLRRWLERLAQALDRGGGCPARRRQLADWIARHDRRRNTDFSTLFPELAFLADAA
jgi:hypothetical protein